MNNYTKGEWKIHRDGAGNLQIFAERGGTGNVVAKVVDDNLANANLIAAAPAMHRRLKATAEIIDYLMHRYVKEVEPFAETLYHLIQDNNKALAKAEDKEVK